MADKTKAAIAEEKPAVATEDQTTVNVEPVDPMKEIETVFIPKSSGEDSVVFVGLNGKSYLIPRGKRVDVPKPVAQIVYEAQRNQQAAEAYQEAEKEKMNIVFGAPN